MNVNQELPKGCTKQFSPSLSSSERDSGETADWVHNEASIGNHIHVLHLMYFRQVKNFIRAFQTGFQKQGHTELGAKGRGAVSCNCIRKENRNTFPGVF